MTSASTLNLIRAVAVLLLAPGALRMFHLLRGRAMRGLASKWGFRYFGQPAPPNWLWNPSHLKTVPPVPTWLSRFHPSGQRIRQVWNVIEGRQNGILVLIFDCVIGEYKGGHPCTLIACQTERDPFVGVTSWDRVVQSHGWTVLHGSWLFWFSWTMGIKRIEDHLTRLRNAPRGEPDHRQVGEQSILAD
jgi:hypothetical protein